ncbi:MAG TPA: nucleotide sugar dehydrogenase [Candidatus Nitrosotalea sp.]|nr:nucleotide sugar dehydrogenase [Candidatus Nitrosotalea sp.]
MLIKDSSYVVDITKLESLSDKIKDHKAVVCVLGLGRVGLPLASVFATRGIKVIGIDVNEQRLNSIRDSKCPFHDPPLQENLEKAISIGNLQVENNLDKVGDMVDIVFLTVGTPTTTDNRVDYSQLYTALNEVCKINMDGKMIILRSTLPPKTTTEIVIPFLEHKTSMKAGIDFGVAMCPERILEGQAIKELHELPEIIGGVNNICNDIVTELFRIINPKKEFLYTTPSGAELAKLFTNIYRYISFALSNEFAIWAETYGLDATELIKIANYNYPRSKIPIPGFVGGPCLSKDGTFLDNNTTFSSIVSASWKLNESIPQHITNNIKKISGNLFNKKIAVLGLSFKSGSDDLRNSPSVKLTEILKSTGAQVLIHDPYVKDTSSLDEILKSPDIVIIATNHKEFKNIVPEITKSGAKIIYDVWGMFKESDFPGMSYVRFGQGI